MTEENVAPLRPSLPEVEALRIQNQILTAYLDGIDPQWRSKVGKRLELAWEQVQ